MDLSFDNITIDPIDLFTKKDIAVSVLRLDKLHPVISGNKWFKLQYYLDDAKEQNKKIIVTFGGAWSNHIVAVAAAASMNGMASTGIIRGDEPSKLSSTLVQAKDYGMQLHFSSRQEYDKKKVPPAWQSNDHYLIPEGGYGEKGVEGAATILNYSTNDFTHCCCAVGTGTMMAGLINASAPGQKLTGISILKNHFELETNVRSLIKDKQKEWQIIHDYHFGGYAKYQPSLLLFMNGFYRSTYIPSDFVYTGKLFYAITDMINKNYFPPGSRLLLIHSGGLQGNNSLEKGTLIF